MPADHSEKIIKRAVFLDRDGVINVEKEYLHRIEEFQFLPGVPQALRLLRDAGFLLIVVTNQSGVARGYYSMDDVHRLHRHLQDKLKPYGVAVDAFYICPHHPDYGTDGSPVECSCRKPLPGLIEQASADFLIDPRSSYLVGDKLSDMEAGRAVGCSCFLVRTGHGARVPVHTLPKDVTVLDDLPAAAEAIVLRESGRL